MFNHLFFVPYLCRMEEHLLCWDAVLAGTFCAFSSYTLASTVHACTQRNHLPLRAEGLGIFVHPADPFCLALGSQSVTLRCIGLSAQGRSG